MQTLADFATLRSWPIVNLSREVEMFAIANLAEFVAISTEERETSCVEKAADPGVKYSILAPQFAFMMFPRVR